MNKVITISREFGSGGRELGFLLAEKLGVPFYDKELISMAAEESGISEETIRKYGEMIHHIEDDDRYKCHMSFSPIYQIPMSDQIFVAQSSIVRQLASKGPCVITGRCADRILEDSVNVFLHASMNERKKRILALYPDEDETTLEMRIKSIDAKRRDYYQYYTGNIWGKAQNYDLCIDSGKAGSEGSLETIVTYLKYL